VPVERKSVLLVAAQAPGQSAGRDNAAQRERETASFALVSDEAGGTDAGIELVLGDGRMLRIRRGADEETLRAVLTALGQPSC
jgi:hypothetical protein